MQLILEAISALEFIIALIEKIDPNAAQNPILLEVHSVIEKLKSILSIAPALPVK